LFQLKQLEWLKVLYAIKLKSRSTISSMIISSYFY